MLKRTITGACYVAILVGFFFLRMISTDLFLPLVYAFSIIGTFEIVRAFKEKLTTSQKVVLFAFAIIFTPVYYLTQHFLSEGFMYMVICAFVIAIVVLSLLVFDKNTTIEGTGCSLFAMLYPTIILGTMIIANDFGQYYSTLALLLIFIISPCADTFAYLVGSTFKGKKLCPEISPNKTISGAIGGLIGGLLSSILVYHLYCVCISSFTGLNFAISPWIVFAIIGFICAILTEFGDLVESVIKRKVGIKDMGNLLPGHGGILDRIDGTLFASMFICFVFALFVV